MKELQLTMDMNIRDVTSGLVQLTRLCIAGM